jgi:chromosome segregation ATPase
VSGFIDWAMTAVEKHSQRHAIEGTELVTLLHGRPRRNYEKRTHEELLADVNELYDKLISLVRERDELRAQLTKAQRKLDSLNIKFWIVSAAVVSEGCVIAFLANELFSRLH